jgi:hypothetical protein
MGECCTDLCNLRARSFMVVSVADTSPSIPASVASQASQGETAEATLEERNLQALILERLQQLPIAQQQLILDLVELWLERSQQEAEDIKDELPSAVECFRLGWEDMLKGNTIPLDQLWDGI